MLNWEHILFRSLSYIGILSPFVVLICYLICCTLQYLEQKSEKEKQVRRMEKKYNKQNKLNHPVYSDIASEISTLSLSIKIENPNQHLYRMDDIQSEMNGDSIKGNFINVPDKRHLKYPDSILLFPESNSTSEDETDSQEEQQERFSFQEEEELIPLKPKSNKHSKCRDIRQEVIHNDNSRIKQCRCNSEDKILYTMQKNKQKQDYSTGNRNYDDISLTIEPAEAIHKSNNRKTGVDDKEFKDSSGKNVSSTNEKSEADDISSTQRFLQYGFENDQENMVKFKNKPALLKTHEKCPMCRVSREIFFSEMQHEKNSQHGRYNTGENNKHHKDLKFSLFQNSNIPIAKRVLEEDEFCDLRQKFCGTENIFLNASRSMKDESCFNAWNKNNNQVYQYDENNYAIIGEKHFEDEIRKNTTKQHSVQTTNYTEEIINENQTENVSSTSTAKEELVCNFWKSLKTKTDNQKSDKAVQTQTDILSVGQNSPELILQYADEVCDLHKQKYHEVVSHIQEQQATIKQPQSTKAKNAQSSTRNQSTQTNVNIKPSISMESSQIEIIEHHPKVQLFPTQMPYDGRNVKIRTSRNCQVSPPEANHSEEITYAVKTGSLSTGPGQIQTEFQYPCYRYLSTDYAQPNENTENIQHYENCLFRPNFPVKSKNMYNRYNTDCALQNKQSYICNPIMPMNHSESNQFLNSYNDIPQRQMQRMYLEHQNIPLRNYYVQTGQPDENKHRISAMEKYTYHKNEDTQQQRGNRQMSNFCESPNKISVVTHQPMLNYNSTDNFNNQTNSRNDEYGVMQENGFHDRYREKRNKNNSVQHLYHNSRNNRSKIHNNEADTDVKEIQTSKEILITPNHKKEHGKQTLKETVKKSNSQMKVNSEQFIEKSNAEQIQAKENVLRQIKRMYAHIDQNVHETNKNVITQVKKVLKTKGIWHSENK